MKWSIKVGRVAGIDLYLHLTFLGLVAWLAISNYTEHRDVVAALESIGFVLLLFAIVVLHELGHALTARRYGIKTKDITLLPIGGVARLERMPEDPKQELIVALAGPAVNVVLALIILVIIAAQVGLSAATDFHIIGGSLLVRLLWVNIFLAGFNMLPAFPMDGGRVLRAVLAMKMNRVKATQIAASIGQFMAMLFGLAAFLLQPFNPVLLLIALFVWIGAEAEAQQVRATAFLKGVPVRAVMATEFHTVAPGDRLEDVGRELVTGFQSDFPILEDGKLIGFVGLQDVIKGLAEQGSGATARDFIHSGFQTATPNESLETVLIRWQAEDAPVLAVLDGETLVGLVTRSNIGEHVMVQSALSRSK